MAQECDLRRKEDSSFMDLGLLPEIRGKYSLQRPLHKITWFQVGGVADIIVKPEDKEDLSVFIKHKPRGFPVVCLGVGSNILVRSGGIRGAVVRLGRGFTYMKALEGGKICVGAGTLDRQVALFAQSLGWGGVSFLAGIPGTLGGAVYMNAGCYGTEIKDVLVEATVCDQKGHLKHRSKNELGFAYRSSGIASGEIVVEAILQTHPSTPQDVQKEIEEITQARTATQPLKSATGGSTFANPPGMRAWELIDQAGCRGLTKGGAMVSSLHCNFLINTGTGTAEDIEWLMEEVERRVFETSGIKLHREIQCLGERRSLTPGGALLQNKITQKGMDSL